MTERKLIGPPHAHLDGACGDGCYEEAAPAAPALPELTDAEKLAAIETYLKVLKARADELRVNVTQDMGKRHVEKVGAYLPDGTKLASVSHSDGARKAVVIDEAAALAWCKRVHPSEVQTVEVVRPAYLTMLLALAKADDAPAGAKGVDPETGEELDFIEVKQGSPYVTVTTTADGRARMTALANGFAGMLGAAE